MSSNIFEFFCVCVCVARTRQDYFRNRYFDAGFQLDLKNANVLNRRDK